MKIPCLIQRCELEGDNKLTYEYMGSSEFEWGDQAKALQRIFAAGMTTSTTTVQKHGKEVVVYTIAATGFDFASYQPYLQQLADSVLRPMEWTRFDILVDEKAGVKEERGYTIRTKAWFDFENDILWTLDEEDHKRLLTALEDIRTKWAEREAK